MKLKILRSWPEKVRGLIGEKKPYPIYFHTRWGIHTFGLKFYIDVIILDRDFRVAKIALNLGPNKLFFWPVKYYHVLELPSGEVRRLNIRIGDKINLDY